MEKVTFKIKLAKNMLILIFILWCVFSFVLMEYNPIIWSQFTRILFVLSPLIYFTVGTTASIIFFTK